MEKALDKSRTPLITLLTNEKIVVHRPLVLIEIIVKATAYFSRLLLIMLFAFFKITFEISWIAV